MALAHNIIIRGLNSVYVQAPYVKVADQQAFLLYARNLFRMLAIHHDSEEETIFPAVERMAGEPGVMAANVAQKQAFHGGIDALLAYIGAVLDGGEHLPTMPARGMGGTGPASVGGVCALV